MKKPGGASERPPGSGSKGLLKGPDIGPQSQFLIVRVRLAERIHDIGYLVVRHGGKEGMVLGRPGVVAQVRFAFVGAAAADFSTISSL